MAIYNVKNLCESTRTKLKDAIGKLEQFLNNQSLSQLNSENDQAMDEFYRGYLSDSRHLLVFCEVAYEKLGVSLRRPNFNVEYSEKVLYDVYHNCVNSFFYPKNECYSEDGRYAYTGQDAIRFRKKPTREVRDLTIELSKIFEELREDLSYYETDYITQRRMQGEKV
ncbi:YpuI family protein [Paenibacillus aurantius]|uniref:YpuI family protein n=1 Tax=Paenibacillus aurantius TaxID=2918900 RepID=A0AA96LHM5_9BACL|nr:YpuI family protein [Paenibacillus aurantius]WJH33048.1 YpuI family protein [Paenibacillus sp. CC-CFT747]WNQ13478.1 YpuI family protein [Paenibacillus aurantius]